MLLDRLKETWISCAEEILTPDDIGNQLFWAHDYGPIIRPIIINIDCVHRSFWERLFGVRETFRVTVLGSCT